MGGLWDADISAGKTLLEYVWVAADSQLRSKTRVLDARPTCVEEVPVLTATVADEALPTECEVLLQPRKLFRDPFREGSHLLVLCDTFQVEAPAPPPCTTSGPALPAFSFVPHKSNHRAACAEVLACAQAEQPVFAFEQEYCVKAAEGPYLPGLSSSGAPLAHPYIPLPGQQICQVADAPLAGTKPAPPLGAEARRLAQLHLLTCLRAGINISEISQKVRETDVSLYYSETSSASPPPVWSYQLGPNVGIDAADHLWMSRFVMQRVSEQEGIEVSFDSKGATYGGSSGGLRCRTEVSTSASRTHGSGLSEIERHMVLMHAAQLQQGLPGYGKLSQQAAQLAATGGLRVGAGKSSANPALALDIMIPTVTLMQQGGHWVDCRPAADADPYSVVTTLVTALQLPRSSRAAFPGVVPHQYHATECHKTRPDDSKPAPTFKRSKSLHDPAPCYSSYASDISLLSDEADSDDTASMNSLTSEDVLIAEINKIDRAPKRSRNSQTQGGSYTKHAGCSLHNSYQCPFVEEGFDEYCSSKWSPVHA